jgi:hypothetical protein
MCRGVPLRAPAGHAQGARAAPSPERLPSSLSWPYQRPGGTVTGFEERGGASHVGVRWSLIVPVKHLGLAKTRLARAAGDAEVVLCPPAVSLASVRDAGVGIPVGDQPRIFERFVRGTDAHRLYRGSGLGLAIVKAVAEAHGGKVQLQSRLGEGSKFTVVIPGEPIEEARDASDTDR